MCNKVCDFYKTEHFLYRQWDRGISDNVLEDILSKVKLCTCEQIVIVSRVYLRNKTNKKSLDLFIVLNGKSLITCYYCDFQEFINSRKREVYILISKG